MINKATVILMAILALSVAQEQYATAQTNDPHEKLLKTNPNYKKNYKIAQKFFRSDASQICSKLALDNKLSENDSKVYLITTYYSLTTSTWTTENKKAFLILYFADISWDKASASKINQQFAKLMKKAQDYLTNGDASELKMPMSQQARQESQKIKDTTVDSLF